ncbi:MAG: hypothetical protein LH702_34995 [Phormidesmis sp. CAN_BIN44]|nr:hypothetical protein [Phormidesmis sp. CAN_BIN44]
MSIEELVVEKLQKLDSEQQQQVLAFIDSLPNQQEPAKAEPTSPLGKKLREIRAQIVASGIPLLNDEELDREIAERRGGVAESSS